MIVIDVGCAQWGGAESINPLMEEFWPRVLYGFDPALEEGSVERSDETLIIRSPSVAWIHDGEVRFKVANLGGQIDDDGEPVPCFDLAAFIKECASADNVILKLDCEGCEYTVLPHLRRRNADLLLQLCLVEWHCEACGIGGNGRHGRGCPADRDGWWRRREKVQSRMRCEMREWTL